MSGKLITASLLDSYDWYISCPPSFKANALQQITDSLNRKAWTPTPAILRGMAFEAKVCANLDDITKDDFMVKFEGHSPDVVKFWERCRGGRQQAKVKKTLIINGVEYYLYGKRDIAFAEKTIDIKTTGDFKGPKYYLTKNQHPIYILCTETECFEYLVAEFDDVKERCTGVFVIDASMSIIEAESRVTNKIIEFVAFLATDDELQNAYNTVFCRSW